MVRKNRVHLRGHNFHLLESLIKGNVSLQEIKDATLRKYGTDIAERVESALSKILSGGYSVVLVSGFDDICSRSCPEYESCKEPNSASNHEDRIYEKGYNLKRMKTYSSDEIIEKLSKISFVHR